MIEQKLLIDTFAKAIAMEEGFFKQGKIPTIPQRLNNPCCLATWKDPKGRPYPEVNGYVKFPNVETGWSAARAQCRVNILKRELTFREFFSGKARVYAGFAKRGERRDPTQYAYAVLNAVARKLALEVRSIDIPVISLITPVTP